MRRIAAVIVFSLVAWPACGTKNPLTPTSIVMPLAVETAHFEFHYAPGDHVKTDWEEQYYAWATARLRVPLTQKIGYFKYSNHEEMGDHTGEYKANAFAVPKQMKIHTLNDYDNHEVVHLFMSVYGDAPALFSEGVAVAFQSDPVAGNFDSVFNGEEVHHAARRYLAAGQLVVPLDGLVESKGFRDISDSVLSYREAGSFVRFLIDRYGLDRFIAFYRSGLVYTDAKDKAKAQFQSAMGVSVAEAEAAWLDFLRSGA